MGLLQETRPSTANVLFLADYLVPSYRRRAVAARPQPGPRIQATLPHTAIQPRADPAGEPTAGIAAVRTVRVTHFTEAANARGAVRKLRICGRLSDVCAELDRLAAAEARLAAQPRRA